GNARVDVADELCLAGLLVHDASDSDVENGSARLDPVGLDEGRDADGRNDDVGLAHLIREVDRARVGEGDGGVESLANKQQPERAADGETAPDDADLATGDRN